jgi:hypothetical protein
MDGGAVIGVVTPRSLLLGVQGSRTPEAPRI